MKKNARACTQSGSGRKRRTESKVQGRGVCVGRVGTFELYRRGKGGEAENRKERNGSGEKLEGKCTEEDESQDAG